MFLEFFNSRELVIHVNDSQVTEIFAINQCLVDCAIITLDFRDANIV